MPIASWADRVPSEKQWVLRDLQVRDATFPSPRLFLLDESSDALLEESLRCAGVADDPQDAAASNPAICGWLLARGVPSDVPRHLVAAMQQRNAKFEPVLLRYYDPRALSRLNRILDGEQRKQLLGPIEHWFALDRFGNPGDLQTQSPAPYISSTLSAAAEQWASIERIEAFNRSAAVFEQASGNPLPVEMETELDAALCRAAAYGLTSMDDAITFALYSLMVAPGFDQHPSVAAALASTRSGQGKLADALESLPKQVWQDIAHPSSEQTEQA
ncbi:hypothetical protein AWV80_30330 [Cupriavidus sp. UYMU48A]|nr:hypothetical protein AWV80_30330 [Cupriavidus sp. UYMU48A]